MKEKSDMGILKGYWKSNAQERERLEGNQCKESRKQVRASNGLLLGAPPEGGGNSKRSHPVFELCKRERDQERGRRKVQEKKSSPMSRLRGKKSFGD